eukprot:TRINITY_DN1572_c10_g1_i1.p1 TRINITY_DN1572_c10_g1~~TRINITY_DN1572_c10_g1_i1.p1  ORF type:complete len:591 (+),score=103.89 TRINITY_DN1572_c10_g1_i1:64-1773(+)
MKSVVALLLSGMASVSGLVDVTIAGPNGINRNYLAWQEWDGATDTDINNIGSTRNYRRQFYLGVGRMVKFDHMQLDVAACAATTATLKVKYVELPIEDFECTPEECQREAIKGVETTSGVCVRTRMGYDYATTGPELCTAIKYRPDLNDTNPVTWWSSPDILASAVASRPHAPYYYKTHGKALFKIFLEYEYPLTDTCTSRLTARWIVRAMTPGEEHCVTESDAGVPLELDSFYDYSTERAAQPRHAGTVFKKDTTVLSTKYVDDPVVEHWDQNIHYVDLGRGPIVDLECLHVHTTPLVQSATCQPGQVGHIANNIRVNVLELYGCNAFTYSPTNGQLLGVGLFGENEKERTAYSRCCTQTNSTSCSSVQFTRMAENSFITENVHACMWMEDECLPTYSMTTTDVTSVVGTREKISLQSHAVHSARSTLISDKGLVEARYQGVSARRWFLQLINENIQGSAIGMCDQVVTTSFISATTGGICEPSARQMCEMRAAECRTKPAPRDNAMWWAAKADSNSTWPLEKYSTCNCLKEKEACYRKNGCLATKKYQLILQNCLEEGCGDYCIYRD